MTEISQSRKKLQHANAPVERLRSFNFKEKAPVYPVEKSTHLDEKVTVGVSFASEIGSRSSCFGYCDRGLIASES